MSNTERTGTEALARKTKPDEILYGLLGIVLIFGLPALGIWSVTPDSIRYPVLYRMIYSVSASHVHIEKKPVDCDWGHAPLGDKDCHYVKQVSPISNDRGRVTDVFVSWIKVPD